MLSPAYIRVMKYSILILFAVAMLGTACNNCIEGTGSATDERRATADFSSIEANTTYEVLLHQLPAGESAYVIVNAQENLLPVIITEVSKNTLTLSTDGCVKATSPIIVHVFTPNYASINSRGTGNISGNEGIKAEELTIDNRGTGSIEVITKGSSVEIRNSGTGNVTVEGNTQKLAVDNRGTGNINAQNLRSNDANVDSRGTGNVFIQVHSSLDIKLSGTGDVEYEGNPQDIKQSNKGTGKIRRK